MVASLGSALVLAIVAAHAAARLAVFPLAASLVGIAGAVATLAVPSPWLPGLAMVAWYGFSVDGVREPLGGGLLLPEIVLLVWMLKERSRVFDGFRIERSDLYLFGSLAILIGATVLAGQQFAGLLHLVFLAIVMLWLENGARLSRWALVLGAVATMAIDLATTFEGFTNRLYGNDPAQLGFIAVATWCLLTGMRRSAVVLLLQVFTLFIIAATQTRSVWLAFVLVLAVKFVPRPSRAQLSVVGALVLLVAWQSHDEVTAALGLNSDSERIRAASLRGSMSVIRENPLLGVGWVTENASSALSGLSQAFSTYNVILGLAVPGGLICAALFVLFLAEKVRQARYVNRSTLLIIVAFLAQGAVEMNFYPGSPITYLVLVACGMVTALRTAEVQLVLEAAQEPTMRHAPRPLRVT